MTLPIEEPLDVERGLLSKAVCLNFISFVGRFNSDVCDEAVACFKYFWDAILLWWWLLLWL